MAPRPPALACAWCLGYGLPHVALRHAAGGSWWEAPRAEVLRMVAAGTAEATTCCPACKQRQVDGVPLPRRRPKGADTG